MGWLVAIGCSRTTSEGVHQEQDGASAVPVAEPASAPVLESEREPTGLRCDGQVVSPQLAGLGCHDNEFGRPPMGFSEDGSLLGRCVSACDACPLNCRFEDRAGRVQAFAQYDELRDARVLRIEADKRLSEADSKRKIEALRSEGEREFDTRLARLGLTAGAQGRGLAAAFPYPELHFVQRSHYDEASDVGVVEVGAAVGEEEPVYPIRIEVPPHPSRSKLPLERVTVTGPARAAAIEELRREFAQYFKMEPPKLLYFDLSRDGVEVGAVAGARGTGWYQAAQIVRVPVAAFAGRVFNDTGMRRLKRGDAAGAAQWFARAHAAAPTTSLFAYNLACARARAGQGEVEAALAAALDHGGTAVRRRAKSDRDLDSVRSEPWFGRLIGR